MGFIKDYIFLFFDVDITFGVALICRKFIVYNSFNILNL